MARTRKAAVNDQTMAAVRRQRSEYYTLVLRRILLIFGLFLLIFYSLLSYTKIFDHYKKKIAESGYALSVEYGFGLKNIIIEGQHYLAIEEIINAIRAHKGMSVLAIDINAVKNQLEQIPWVQAAFVERQMPSTIYIAIKERVPTAIWQFQHKLYLIDSEGMRLADVSSREQLNEYGLSDLLYVIGQDAHIYAKRLLEDIKTEPELVNKIVGAVRYGQRRWNLHFNDGLVVKMPENDFLAAYRYLSVLHQRKKLFNQGYRVFDLRDREKVTFEKI